MEREGRWQQPLCTSANRNPMNKDQKILMDSAWVIISRNSLSRLLPGASAIKCFLPANNFIIHIHINMWIGCEILNIFSHFFYFYALENSIEWITTFPVIALWCVTACIYTWNYCKWTTLNAVIKALFIFSEFNEILRDDKQFTHAYFPCRLSLLQKEDANFNFSIKN